MNTVTRKRLTALYYGAAVLLVPVWLAYHAYAKLQNNLHARPRAGDVMPSFPVQTMDGGTVPLESVLAGRQSILVFVKAGCHNCKFMLGVLQQLPQVRSGQLQLIALAQNTPQEALAFRTEDHFEGLLLCDTEKNVYKKAGGLLVPLTFLIDESGRVHDVIEGVRNAATVAGALESFSRRGRA